MHVTLDGNELYNEWSVFMAVITTLMQYKNKGSKFWVSFFEKATAPYFLIIMPHMERVFSVMNGLWTNDRNRMSTELVKAEICLKMNLSVNSGILQNGSGKQDITGICKELEQILILG